MQKNKGFHKSENLESFTFIDLKSSKFPMLNIPMYYGQTPIQHPLLQCHPHLLPTEVCEEKFPIIEYFDSPPPSIHCYKLW